jgi:hypothetical protein
MWSGVNPFELVDVLAEDPAGGRMTLTTPWLSVPQTGPEMSATNQVMARAPRSPRQTHIEAAPKLAKPQKEMVSHRLVIQLQFPSFARIMDRAT